MRFFAALLLVILSPVAASAEGAPTLLQSYGDWEAYRYESGGQLTCYLLSKPKQLRPEGRNHGDVFFFLTTRPSENVTNEVSFLVGYPFAANSTVVVDIDGQKWNLFTKDDGAWLESTADEQQLVAAMRAGRAMTVSGKSERGTDTSYSFSLSGVTAGSNRVADCK